MTSSTPARDPRWHHDSPEEIPGLFGLERARLVDLLGSLTSGDWARPTPCPGWSILDLCGHLLGDDLGWLARHRDQHQPTVNAPTTDDASFARWLDDLQDKWVQAARRLSPRLVTDLLAWSGPQIVAGLANQDPAAVKGSVSWAGPGPVPVWLDQLREVSEQWIHRQQLLQALGQDSDLRPDLAVPVLEGMRWAYPYRLADIPAASGDTATIRLTGPPSFEWHLVAGTDGWRYRPRPGTQIRATMNLATEQAWRLLTNNLPVGEQHQLHLTGDDTVVDVLRKTRAIIGTPNWPPRQVNSQERIERPTGL